MNRKTQKLQPYQLVSGDSEEFRSDPTVFTQRFWYYVMWVGTAKQTRGALHHHQDEPAFLLHYMRRGEMWHSIADRMYRVPQGNVCFMYLQKPTRYGNDRSAEAEVWWTLLGGRDLSDVFLTLEADQNPVFQLKDPARFDKLFLELLALTRDRPPAYQVQSSGILTLMLAELFAARGRGDEPQLDLLHPQTDGTRFSDSVLNAIRRISHHYHEPLTLRDICAAANLNLHHFVRQFRRETGAPPMRYLTRYRVEKAKDLLQITSHPVREVAQLVGIPDSYTFARTFRKITGQSPTEYRDTVRSKHTF